MKKGTSVRKGRNTKLYASGRRLSAKQVDRMRAGMYPGGEFFGNHFHAIGHRFNVSAGEAIVAALGMAAYEDVPGVKQRPITREQLDLWSITLPGQTFQPAVIAEASIEAEQEEKEKGEGNEMAKSSTSSTGSTSSASSSSSTKSGEKKNKAHKFLTHEEAQYARWAYYKRKRTRADIASELDVTPSTIGDILNGAGKWAYMTSVAVTEHDPRYAERETEKPKDEALGPIGVALKQAGVGPEIVGQQLDVTSNKWVWGRDAETPTFAHLWREDSSRERIKSACGLIIYLTQRARLKRDKNRPYCRHCERVFLSWVSVTNAHQSHGEGSITVQNTTGTMEVERPAQPIESATSVPLQNVPAAQVYQGASRVPNLAKSTPTATPSAVPDTEVTPVVIGIDEPEAHETQETQEIQPVPEESIEDVAEAKSTEVGTKAGADPVIQAMLNTVVTLAGGDLSAYGYVSVSDAWKEIKALADEMDALAEFLMEQAAKLRRRQTREPLS